MAGRALEEPAGDQLSDRQADDHPQTGDDDRVGLFSGRLGSGGHGVMGSGRDLCLAAGISSRRPQWGLDLLAQLAADLERGRFGFRCVLTAPRQPRISTR